MRFSGDTTNYAVDSFSNNSSATIEDVLRRLPGIDVDANGKISMHGKPVTKLFLNGVEYAASNLQILTQNMPGEVIDIIQVADWHDEGSSFSGIKKGSGEKMLNLKFKEKYTTGLIDKISGGFGSKERYQLRNFVNWMKGSSRITAIASMNNTGSPNSLNATSLGNSTIPGLSTSKNLNINFSTTIGRKVKLTGTYEFEQKNLYLLQAAFRTTYLPGDTTLLNRQYSEKNSHSLYNRLKLRQSYKADDNTTLITELKISYKKNTSLENASDTAIVEDASTFSRTSINQKHFSSPSISLSNVVQRRFRKERRIVLISFDGVKNESAETSRTNFDNRYYLPPSTSFNSFNKPEESSDLNTHFGVQYTEPVSKNSIVSLKLDYVYSKHQFQREVWNGSDIPSFDTIQSREFQSKDYQTPFEVAYHLDLIQWYFSCNIRIIQYKRVSAFDTFVHVQSQTNYYPSLSLRYNFSAKSDCNINYSGSVITPNVSHLLPMPDFTDSLNILIGNPNLQPEVTHTGSITWNYRTKAKVIWLNLAANIAKQQIVNQTHISSSKRIIRPVNVDGGYDLSLSANYTSFNLRKMLKGTIGFQGHVTRDISIINGFLLPMTSYSFQPDVRLSIELSKWYEGALNYYYGYNKVEAQKSFNVFQRHSISNSGTVFLRRNFKVSFSCEYIFTNGLSDNFENNFFVANFNIERNHLLIKNLSVSAKALDIFNNYPSTQRVIGDRYFEDSILNRVGRYVLFSLMYTFLG